MGRILLRGITWDHSRAVPPLVATAQRFEETHPGIQIEWRKRSLHEFGHQNLADLAPQFDLMVIDHPWAGFALAHNAVCDLHPLFPSKFLQDLRAHSTGLSFPSYEYEGRLIALPIDGATPVASHRPDLLLRAEAAVPRDWNELLALARRGLVLVPGFHVDQVLALIGLALSLGGRPFEGAEQWTDRATGRLALDRMRELMAHVPEIADRLNPIRVYEELSEGDRFAYCPFAYSYNNYSRRGFSSHRLVFGETVAVNGGAALRTVLGGTGLALSPRCPAPEAALEYLRFVAGPECQRTLYVDHGGQPADRRAWLDEEANRTTGNFFRNTLRTMERAWVRPRYDGFIRFQEAAGLPLVRYYRKGGKPDEILDEMDGIYRQSLK